jgi:eukaryotic-like serine/threonine-protein kinase
MRARSRIGDYDVHEVSAAAGLARYDGTHVVLPRKAIVEVADAAARAAAVRLLRQACLLEAMDHRGIPRVFECGMIDGAPWVAFEAMHGVALADVMQHHRLTPDDVLDLLSGVSTILAHAHARGVLHRDITPAVIARDRDRGMWVLGGWDSACTLDAELAPPPHGGARYHAPELEDVRSPDPRSDVFALAMVAHEALTGEVASLPADPARLPPPLGMLLATMLAPNAAARPHAVEVCAQIRAYGGAHRTFARGTSPIPLEREEIAAPQASAR